MKRQIFGPSTLSRRFHAVSTRVAPIAAAASAALILWHAARDKPAAVVAAPAPLVYPNSAAGTPSAPEPVAADSDAGTSPTVQQAGVASTIQVVAGPNDTMDAIFRRMALDKTDLAAIRNLPGIRQSLDFLKPGDAIQVTRTNDGEVRHLSRKVSETQTLEVVRGDTGFAAKLVSNPIETHLRTASATIHSSLFQSAESANISNAVALKLATVFAWDIDFVLDIRAGDHYTVSYEQIYQNGRYVRDGDVVAAQFVNDGRTYRAVRYTPEGGTAGYYTPEGKPLKKAFLRAPVDFTRVSSVFATNRLHPILNMIRGHMGTDYAAPTGTPIHAAGEGRVSFEGTRGGYGNAIMLSHSNNVSTLYGHMSRFARNVHLGSHVNQGDVIGYVGMTGLATGPHLHYEYLMNGVHMNPETVPLPGAEPLRADALQQFLTTAAPLLGGLTAPSSPVAGIPVAGIPAAAAAASVAASTASVRAQSLEEVPSTTSVN